MKVVLVCGGRGFSDIRVINNALTKLHTQYQFTTVIHGAALGADMLADEWARKNNLQVIPFPADWDSYGNSAGPIRNRQMLINGHPTLVIAFPGGKGTRDMVDLARMSKIPVIEVSRDGRIYENGEHSE